MTPIGIVPEKVEVITMACCTLHNFLRSCVEACSVYTPPRNLDTEDPLMHQVQLGEWHYGPQPCGVDQLQGKEVITIRVLPKISSTQRMGKWSGRGRWCKVSICTFLTNMLLYRCI